jgi:hypothetical protein
MKIVVTVVCETQEEDKHTGLETYRGERTFAIDTQNSPKVDSKVIETLAAQAFREAAANMINVRML